MLLGTNRPEGWVRTDRKVGTKRLKRLSLGTNRLGTKGPYDWIPSWSQHVNCHAKIETSCCTMQNLELSNALVDTKDVLP